MANVHAGLAPQVALIDQSPYDATVPSAHSGGGCVLGLSAVLQSVLEEVVVVVATAEDDKRCYTKPQL